MEKVGKLERAVGELGQRMDSTGRLADTLVAECSRKVSSSPCKLMDIKIMTTMMFSRLTRRNWTTSEVGWRRSDARSTTSR